MEIDLATGEAAGGWSLRRLQGSARELHEIDLPTDERSVWLMETRQAALVLGSTQTVDEIDLASMDEAGVEVTRRRSGGGAVLIVPGECRWVDVVIPADDVLWEVDVSRSFLWLGEGWAEALRDLGIPADVHHGPSLDIARGRVACFAGIGSGEVVSDGRKVVGLSQRRTRGGARFQCIIHERFDAARTAAIVRSDAMWAEMVEHLAASVGVVPDVDTALDAMVGRLP